jgi:hypothetical protein
MQKFRSIYSIESKFIRLLFVFYATISSFIGSIIIVPFSILFVFDMVNPIDRFYFPNESYAEMHAFSPFDHDVLLWHADGYPLSKNPIDMVCFNDRFVSVWPVKGPNYVYEKAAGDVIYSGQPGYDTMMDRSKLRKRRGGCNGHVKAHTGPMMLLEKFGSNRTCRSDWSLD